MVRPSGAASSTPSMLANLSDSVMSMTERVKAESVWVPSAKAMTSLSIAFRPETPSLTNPAVRPEMMTTSQDMSVNTTLMRRDRVRAKSISRKARNMMKLPGVEVGEVSG